MTQSIGWQIAALQLEREQSLAYFEQAFKALVHKYAQELFDEYPNLESFGWCQGEPWRDGNETYFEVPVYDQLFVNKKTYDDYPEVDTEAEKHFEVVRKFMDSFTEDEFLLMFGNGSAVTINREGIEIEGWSDA
jgi:hypothetical protein